MNSDKISDYWYKQSKEKPLFSDLLWSRPENKTQAGKLLIAGGNVHSFAAVGQAYAESINAGIGVARVLLPDALQKTVGKVLPEGEYAPSSASGSFGQKALAELVEMAHWADCMLLAGDFGRNSETAILLEKFANKYTGPLVLTQDAIDYFNKNSNIMSRRSTILVLSFAQLQKLAIASKFCTPFKYEMDFLLLLRVLHDFTKHIETSIIVKREDKIFVAVKGRISTTTDNEHDNIWRVKAASHAAVWWLQNPTKTFEALTTSQLDK